MFGRNDNKQTVKAGREHWYKNGSQQTPPLNIDVNYEDEKPFKCADYGGDCSCPGRVHLGLKFRRDNGDEITTFDGLKDWKKGEKWHQDKSYTSLSCTKNNFKKKGK